MIKAAIFRSVAAVLCLSPLSACDNFGGGADERAAARVTLYRNAFNTPNARIHWATFDAFKNLAENSEDCEMTARIMNANMDAYADQRSAPQYAAIHFWCEAGDYTTLGENPAEYAAEYPSNRKRGRAVGR